jgi:hypothetical protein
MDEYQFLLLQSHLWNAYGYVFMWWLILFAVMGIGLAAMIFFLVTVRNWLDRS